MKKILHVCASVVNVAFFRAAAAIFWGQTTWDWCKIVFCSTVKGLFIKVKSPVTHPPQVLNRKKKRSHQYTREEVVYIKMLRCTHAAPRA